jgi:3-mercaptopyruvate sulfurtransferase SseA
VTKRKICVFEVAVEQSRDSYEKEHIQGARLLFFSNLSHAGVPVHPLQFQRYARNLGIDSECTVVVYDKEGQMIWSTYAFWIFKLFGHERTSLLNGGFTEWKAKAKDQSNLYQIESGQEEPVENLGNFRSRWSSEYILTFDDVIANFDSGEYELVDAQSVEVGNPFLTRNAHKLILRSMKEKPKELFLATFVLLSTYQ